MSSHGLTETPPTSARGTLAPTRVELLLELDAPFRLDLTALALVRRANNLIDRWQGGTYRRVVPVSEPHGPRAVPQFLLQVSDATAEGQGSLTHQLLVAATGYLDEERLAVEAQRVVLHIFGLDQDLTAFYAMAAADERLVHLVADLKGLRPPRYPSLFQALLNAVPCQQVTLVLGLRLLARLAVRYGPSLEFAPLDAQEGPLPLPAAAQLAGADPAELGALGFSRAKARTLTELAAELVAGTLDLAELSQKPNQEVADRLQQLFGIGRWTSDYALLRGLGRLDVFPYGDSGARNGLARFMGQAGKPSYDWVAQTVEPWQPFGGFVYLHLLVAGMLRSGDFEAD